MILFLSFDSWLSLNTKVVFFQVSAFTSKGLPAAFVGSEQDDKAVKDAILKGQHHAACVHWPKVLNPKSAVEGDVAI